MNVNLIGSFFFEAQGYGIINGVYHNIITAEPYPENAKKDTKAKINSHDNDLFQGIYSSVWLEQNNLDNTRLRIERQPDGTYRFLWYTRDRIHFEGIGFLSKEKLIGSYWEINTDELRLDWGLTTQKLIST